VCRPLRRPRPAALLRPDSDRWNNGNGPHAVTVTRPSAILRGRPEFEPPRTIQCTFFRTPERPLATATRKIPGGLHRPLYCGCNGQFEIDCKAFSQAPRCSRPFAVADHNTNPILNMTRHGQPTSSWLRGIPAI
jgi:hypothetical protein